MVVDSGADVRMRGSPEEGEPGDQAHDCRGAPVRGASARLIERVGLDGIGTRTTALGDALLKKSFHSSNKRRAAGVRTSSVGTRPSNLARRASGDEIRRPCTDVETPGFRLPVSFGPHHQSRGACLDTVHPTTAASLPYPGDRSRASRQIPRDEHPTRRRRYLDRTGRSGTAPRPRQTQS